MTAWRWFYVQFHYNDACICTLQFWFKVHKTVFLHIFWNTNNTKTGQIIRNWATATLRHPQIQQDTVPSEGYKKTTDNSYNFDLEWSGGPVGRFVKIRKIILKNHFVYLKYYLAKMFAYFWILWNICKDTSKWIEIVIDINIAKSAGKRYLEQLALRSSIRSFVRLTDSKAQYFMMHWFGLYDCSFNDCWH